MRDLIVFVVMMFMHYIADFILQTDKVANLKQKSWWDKNYPNKKYANDYKVVLVLHAFSWSACVMAPAVWYLFHSVGHTPDDPVLFGIQLLLFGNTITHALIDDIKANKGTMSLLMDQLLHTIQIYITLILITWIM